MDLDSLFNSIQEKEEKLGSKKLNNVEILFVSLMTLWYEVGNGGLFQFLSNPGIQDVKKIPKYLKIINATTLSNKLRKIYFYFGILGPSSNLYTRIKKMNAFKEFILEEMNEFDELLNNQEEEDIEELLILFVEKNHNFIK